MTRGASDPVSLAEDPPEPAGTSRRVALVALASLAVVSAGGMVLLSRQAGAGTGISGGSSRSASGRTVTEFTTGERGEPVVLGGTTLTGGTSDLADLRGRVVVINVWGSWCVPCRLEAPILARVSTEYADRVTFLGVNVKDNAAAALAFEAEYGITYPSIEDTDGRAILALTQYVPAAAVPVTLVLDRQGRVASRILGTVDESVLRSLLDSVLSEPM